MKATTCFFSAHRMPKENLAREKEPLKHIKNQLQFVLYQWILNLTKLCIFVLCHKTVIQE